MKGTSVDPERLAALLDGRLDARARAELLAQIAASDEALGDLADAAGVLLELEKNGGGAASRGATVPRRRWPPSAWLAIAAVFVVAFLAPWLALKSRPSSRAEARVVQLLSARQYPLPAAWAEDPWPRTRGELPMSADARAVRLGAYLVDFESAQRAADRRAPIIAARIAGLLEELPAGAALSGPYRDAASQKLDTAALRDARTAAVRAAGVTPSVLGIWVEEARLAAAARDSGYFRGADFGDAEEWMRRTRSATPTVTAALARARLATRATAGIDWPSLQQSLTTVMSELGRPH